MMYLEALDTEEANGKISMEIALIKIKTSRADMKITLNLK